MKNLRFNIFLLHRINNGIIFEIFHTNKPFNFSFLNLCIQFKRITCGKNEFDLRDLVVTYGISSRNMLFLLFLFFDHDFKNLLFPFNFKIKILSANNTFKEKFFAYFFEFFMNIGLIFS